MFKSLAVAVLAASMAAPCTAAAPSSQHEAPAVEAATGPMPARPAQRWPMPSEAEVVETWVRGDDRMESTYVLRVGRGDSAGEYVWSIEPGETRQPENRVLFRVVLPEDQPTIRLDAKGDAIGFADATFVEEAMSEFAEVDGEDAAAREQRATAFAQMVVEVVVRRFGELWIPSSLPAKRGEEQAVDGGEGTTAGSALREVIRNDGPAPGRPGVTRYAIVTTSSGEVGDGARIRGEGTLDVDDATGRLLSAVRRVEVTTPAGTQRTESRYELRWKTIADEIATVRKRGEFGRFDPPEDRTLPSFAVRYSLRYPPSAVRLRQSGTARVRVAVDESGNVTDAAVVDSTGTPILDDEALRSTRAAKFHPALREGKPVASLADTTVSFTFAKDEPGDEEAADAETIGHLLRGMAGASTPVVASCDDGVHYVVRRNGEVVAEGRKCRDGASIATSDGPRLRLQPFGDDVGVVFETPPSGQPQGGEPVFVLTRVPVDGEPHTVRHGTDDYAFVLKPARIESQ